MNYGFPPSSRFCSIFLDSAESLLMEEKHKEHGHTFTDQVYYGEEPLGILVQSPRFMGFVPCGVDD
jgi:hypothetical protein